MLLCLVNFGPKNRTQTHGIFLCLDASTAYGVLRYLHTGWIPLEQFYRLHAVNVCGPTKHREKATVINRHVCVGKTTKSGKKQCKRKE